MVWRRALELQVLGTNVVAHRQPYGSRMKSTAKVRLLFLISGENLVVACLLWKTLHGCNHNPALILQGDSLN